MQHKKLETVVWLSRLGNFRAVAERLNTTQAAISQRLASLERELGVRLFERTSRSLKLTPKGLELLPYAEKIVDLSAEMVVRVADESSFGGTLRLGVVETIAKVWLPQLLERIYVQFPHVTIDLIVDTSVLLRDHLISGDLDLAFVIGPVNQPGLEKDLLCSYPLAWVASPKLGLQGKRLSRRQLATLPIITFSRRSVPYAMLRDMFRGLDAPSVRLNASGSLFVSTRMAEMGLGIALLPPVAIRSELESGQLQILDTDFSSPALDYFGIYQSTPRNPIAEHVIRMAIEEAGLAIDK